MLTASSMTIATCLLAGTRRGTLACDDMNNSARTSEAAMKNGAPGTTTGGSRPSPNDASTKAREQRAP